MSKKPVSYIINGKQFDVLVDSHQMLSHVIREQVGLTGTKIGCEQGCCGACTVLVNNQPKLSCITPALRFNGAKITTIEGVATDAKLHRLQEKFVEKGAVQCGFCTPGIPTQPNFNICDFNRFLHDASHKNCCCKQFVLLAI